MSSEGQEWEIVKTVSTDEEAAVVAGFLRSNGIPAEVESLRFHELPVDVGELSEVRVRVPPDRAAEARALLAAGEAGATEEDLAGAARPGKPRE